MATQHVLRIRNAQLGTLGLSVFDGFVQRLAQQLAEVFPGHATFLRSPSGKRWLLRSVERARSYGLNDRRGVCLFGSLWAALGADFDRQPEHAWIHELLADQGLGPTARMYLIYRQLPTRCPQAPLGPPPFDADEGEGSAVVEMAPPDLVPLTVGPDAWT